MSEIKCIGILTSGGEAPGMNAAIRAVTRSAIFNGFSVKGIMRGYKGLVFNEIVEFKSQSVSNIIQLGGTILKTARCKEFTTPEGRKAAYDNMTAAGIDALVVIGGDGSLTGARLFAQEYNVPIVGLPGTIDNDLGGTDSTIGYDTALYTIMEAVDKLRDTASSHERLFFVEVMATRPATWPSTAPSPPDPRRQSSPRWRPRWTSWPNSSTTGSARARIRQSSSSPKTPRRAVPRPWPSASRRSSRNTMPG